MRRTLMLFSAMCFSIPALSQPATTLEKGETGKIVFQSITPSGRPGEMHKTGRNLPPVQVSGQLQLPRMASGKVPAMVLLHAAGGVSDRNLAMWEDKFLDLGIATFTIDSLSARGLSFGHTFTHHGQMVDAYEALKLLATHPGIDAGRIAVIGFSMGARATMEAPMNYFRTLFGAGDLRFAAYFSLYPTCNFRYMGGTVRAEPMVVFIPEKEDWTVPAYCEKYVESLNARGGNARPVLLAGAYHGFDQLGRNMYKAAFRNDGTCNVEVSMKGIQRADTGESIASAEAFKTYWSGCAGTQASVVGDSAVLSKVEADIKSVLSTAFNIQLK